MHRLVHAAALAAFAIVADPAAAQQHGYTPPPGYVLVPAPPPPGAQPGATPGQPVGQNPTTAAVSAERSFALSLQAGPSFGGTLTTEYTSAVDWDVDPGFVALARLDFYLVQRFTMGLYGQFLRTSLPERDEDLGVNGFGLSMIGRIGTPDRLNVRLGLLLGYQTNDLESPIADGSEGLGLGAILEVAYPFHPSLGFLAHLSFMTQPAGGNDDIDLTFGPIWYLAAGLEFGK